MCKNNSKLNYLIISVHDPEDNIEVTLQEIETEIQDLDESVFVSCNTPACSPTLTPPPCTSSGQVYHAAPPRHNYFGSSESSDIQMDHCGLPLSPRRTRSSTRSSTSSSQSSHTRTCEHCKKSYGKTYFPKHICKP